MYPLHPSGFNFLLNSTKKSITPASCVFREFRILCLLRHPEICPYHFSLVPSKNLLVMSSVCVTCILKNYSLSKYTTSSNSRPSSHREMWNLSRLLLLLPALKVHHLCLLSPLKIPPSQGRSWGEITTPKLHHPMLQTFLERS